MISKNEINDEKLRVLGIIESLKDTMFLIYRADTDGFGSDNTKKAFQHMENALVELKGRVDAICEERNAAVKS